MGATQGVQSGSHGDGRNGVMAEQIDDYDEIVRVLGEVAGTRYDMPITEFLDVAVSGPADTGSYRARVLWVH
jgi:hypothetical protein